MHQQCEDLRALEADLEELVAASDLEAKRSKDALRQQADSLRLFETSLQRLADARAREARLKEKRPTSTEPSESEQMLARLEPLMEKIMNTSEQLVNVSLKAKKRVLLTSVHHQATTIPSRKPPKVILVHLPEGKRPGAASSLLMEVSAEEAVPAEAYEEAHDRLANTTAFEHHHPNKVVYAMNRAVVVGVANSILILMCVYFCRGSPKSGLAKCDGDVRRRGPSSPTHRHQRDREHREQRHQQRDRDRERDRYRRA